MLKEIDFPESLEIVATGKRHTFWNEAKDRREKYVEALQAVLPDMRARVRVATRKANFLTLAGTVFYGAILLGSWRVWDLFSAFIILALSVVVTCGIFGAISQSFWKGIIRMKEDSETIASDPLHKLESQVLDFARSLKKSVDAYNSYVRLERVGRLSPGQASFLSELKPKIERVIQYVDQRREVAEAYYGIRKAGLAFSGLLPRLGVDIEEMEAAIEALSEFSQGALMSEVEEALRNEDALLDLQNDLNLLPRSVA